MSKYLIVECQWPPDGYHYPVKRGEPDGEESRKGAEAQLICAGCTRIDHCADGSMMSYGTVERADVVRQRIMMPRYD